MIEPQLMHKPNVRSKNGIQEHACRQATYSRNIDFRTTHAPAIVKKILSTKVQQNFQLCKFFLYFFLFIFLGSMPQIQKQTQDCSPPPPRNPNQKQRSPWISPRASESDISSLPCLSTFDLERSGLSTLIFTFLFLHQHHPYKHRKHSIDLLLCPPFI